MAEIGQGNGRVLLVVPPFTDTNGPYASVTYLAGYLSRMGLDPVCVDLGIEVLDRLLSPTGIQRLAAAAPCATTNWPAYMRAIGPVMRFLRGADASLSLLLARYGWLPTDTEAPRSGSGRSALAAGAGAPDGGWAVEDIAKLMASNFVRHVADLFRCLDDERFGLTAFGDAIVAESATFEAAAQRLSAHRSIVTRTIEEATLDVLQTVRPLVVGISVPFTGTLCGAIEVATVIRRHLPDTVIVLGGGYISTELRNLGDATAFRFFDYIVLDDGYEPLQTIIDRTRDHRKGSRAASPALERTFCLVDGQVRWHGGNGRHTRHAESGPPTHAGLDLGKYFALLDMPNRVHRLWSDWRWNKLTLTQGCYWRKCSFCDVHLDYVGRYERAPATVVVDWMERLIAETGSTGFHFVDEAMPPAMMARLSDELISRGLCVSWWGNIRFERSYTPELVDLIARAGCVAVTAGLETPNDRLLADMAKGITVAGAARVMRLLADRGVLVHAYLMYGYPGETMQDTVDGLELVRQLFQAGYLHSAHWHRFALTRHSPLGLRQLVAGASPPGRSLGDLEMPYDPADGLDYHDIGEALRTSLAAYKIGDGLDRPVTSWFRGGAPAPSVAADYIRSLAFTR